MQTTKLSSKGQVVLPRAVRASRRWGTGTEFAVIETKEGVLLMPLAPESSFAPTQMDDVFGSAGYSGPPLTLQAMDGAVLAEAKRRGGR